MPVVPADLLEYVHLPSTYIMGVHTSHRGLIDEQAGLVSATYHSEGLSYLADHCHTPKIGTLSRLYIHVAHEG